MAENTFKIDLSKELEAIKQVSASFNNFANAMGDLKMTASKITDDLEKALAQAIMTSPEFHDMYVQEENVPIEDAVAILTLGEYQHLLVNFQSLDPLNITMLIHTAFSVLKKKDPKLYNEIIQTCQLAYMFRDSEDEDWSGLDESDNPINSSMVAKLLIPEDDEDFQIGGARE